MWLNILEKTSIAKCRATDRNQHFEFKLWARKLKIHEKKIMTKISNKSWEKNQLPNVVNKSNKTLNKSFKKTVGTLTLCLAMFQNGLGGGQRHLYPQNDFISTFFKCVSSYQSFKTWMKELFLIPNFTCILKKFKIWA